MMDMIVEEIALFRRMLTVLSMAGVLILPASLPAQEEEDLQEAPKVPPVIEATDEPAEDSIDDAYDQIQVLTEVMLHVKKHYVDEESYEKIIHGALHGMLQSLDPYSGFLEPQAYTSMQEDTAGKFSGIGIHVGMRHGLLTIIAPIEDTPGFRAGLQGGDRIVAIDGEKTLGMTLREAVKRMRGPKGDKVVLAIQREDEEPQDIEIVRDDIEVPSVKGARIIRDHVGYIRITQFAEPTAESLQVELEKLLADGMNSLVLDLRSNPGGLLKSAIDVAQKFLARGQVIVSTKGRAGVIEDMESRARGKYHYVDFPMTILINGGSASASEIVSGALKDHKRAVLVGENTFGKGSVQSVIRLQSDQNSAIRMTTARYYTPSGRQIHENGIEPDIIVPLTPDEWRRVVVHRAQIENPEHFTVEERQEYSDVVDPQLERALDLLQAIKIFKDKG